MAKTIISETPAVNMIGKGTSIKGDIRSDGDFRVDGILHGTIQSNGKIVVGISGSIEGDINCQNADISGQVKAILRVKEMLSLKATSKMTGEVYTSKLAIEPGARFSGTCNMEDEPVTRGHQENKQNESITREKEKGTG